METTLDRFGRIVIPKKMRDDLNLKPGKPLRIEERQNGVLITPLREGSFLKYKKGILVFTGETTGDVTGLVRKDREARMRKIMGLNRR